MTKTAANPVYGETMNAAVSMSPRATALNITPATLSLIEIPPVRRTRLRSKRSSLCMDFGWLCDEQCRLYLGNTEYTMNHHCEFWFDRSYMSSYLNYTGTKPSCQANLGEKNFSGIGFSLGELFPTKKQVVARGLPAILPNNTETWEYSVSIYNYTIFNFWGTIKNPLFL